MAADTEEHAIDAARSIKVKYEVLPHVTIEERALSGSAPEVFTGGNVRPGNPQEAGDLAAGFQAAAHIARGDLLDPGNHPHVPGDRTGPCANGTATS